MVRKLSLKKVLTPRIDQEILMFGKRDLVLDNHKLLALGFRYKYPGFSKGWERTLAWYLKNRWIPGPKEV
jgi:nucleoside-diphosphate-sugar epimerase